jgi:hypothetical protein
VSPTTEAWKRLGGLLTERRVQINPEYRNRLRFVADTGLHERLVSDLEKGRRESYRDTTLQAVEIAYRLKPNTLTSALEGGPLVPIEATASVSQVSLSTPASPASDVHIEQDDERHLRVVVTMDTSEITMEEAIERLRQLSPTGDLTDNERATIAMLKGIGSTPEQVAGAILLLRGLAERQAEHGNADRRNA